MVKQKKAGYLILATILAIFYIAPFAVVLVNSLKGRLEVLRDPIAFPTQLDMANYTAAWEKMSYPVAFMNSLLVTVVALAVLTIFPAMMGYYLARFETRFTKFIYGLLIVSMIIPFQALMIPFVSIYGRLDMLNSRAALIYFYLGFGVSLSTFLYQGFIQNIPIALDESAAIEGASKLQIFWRVIFPLLKPIFTTSLILNALWIWNDFLLPSLVLFQGARTLPLTAFSFYGQYTSQYGQAMAGLVLSIIPIIVFYIALQRNIIDGITEGAVK
ncbi:MAG: carbohydrate ABC transporter permease [Chloroflexi bacterium]|nr:carbohydrate ABC transporter permease [Chloroflexota bacterium]MBP8059553.1 carbohydrate ABC transporter permease [Chloroflexota bacterium]